MSQFLDGSFYKAVQTLTDSVTTLEGRVTALEGWKALLKAKRADRYVQALDGNGEAVISFPGGRYTNTPAIIAHVVYNNNDNAVTIFPKAVSNTEVTFKVKRSRTLALLGNTVENHGGTPDIIVTAIEF